MRFLTRGLVLMISLAVGATAASLTSGESLVVGGDGRGPLSAGLSNYPVGAAFVYGGTSPDLFVSAGRFSHQPGLFLYRWVATGAEGAPVFGPHVAVKHPGGQVPPTGAIFQARSGTIYGFWLIKNELVRTRFDRARLAFVPLPVRAIALGSAAVADKLNPDNRTADRLAVLENTDGSLEVILSVSDGTAFRPPQPPGSRDPAFQPFTGAGIWRGGWPYVFLRAGHLATPEADVTELRDVHLASATQREALLSHGNIAIVNLGPGHAHDVLTGSHFGNFYFYRNRAESGVRLDGQELVRDTAARVLRSPIISASPVAYPSPDGGHSDLIVGGEGALSYFRFAGFEAGGRPQFQDPVAVREEHALLYAGSLPVVNSVDWDGDGVTDIVAGNSEGRILFFRNRGTTAQPDFGPGVPLAAGGEEIHTQSGYWGIQGPGESRWGYVSPCVADWNGDGLPDILASDATAHHVVWLNLGTRGAPRLDVARPLYCDGIDVHGTWRVRPAAGRLGARTAYVALDDDDQFHLYARIDDQNLRDEGKLRLDDGAPIGANFLAAGGTGRSKLTLADWDGDGVVDLIVGTPRHGSVPNPKTGLPQAKGLPGSAVLWLRNTGTNEAPKFAFPRLLAVHGRPVYLGQHECSVAVTDLGGPGGPHLIVGDEEGRILFFRRDDITWVP
jgi:hypothetical protein